MSSNCKQLPWIDFYKHAVTGNWPILQVSWFVSLMHRQLSWLTQGPLSGSLQLKLHPFDTASKNTKLVIKYVDGWNIQIAIVKVHRWSMERLERISYQSTRLSRCNLLHCWSCVYQQPMNLTGSGPGQDPSAYIAGDVPSLKLQRQFFRLPHLHIL